MAKNGVLTFSTDSSINVIDITGDVAGFVAESGCREGAVLVFVNGSTASVSTIEYEPGLRKDIVEALQRLFPKGKDEIHGTFGLGFVLQNKIQLDLAGNFSRSVSEILLSAVFRF